MLTLGIDTATKVCTVALVRDQEPVASYELNIGMTHSERLIPQLEQLFSGTRLKKQDVELIAVSRGPGSFTGLRIGLATAEALAYGLKIPLVAVNTLQAMTYNLPVENILLAPVLDAQKGNYYLAVYKWQKGRLQEIAPVEIVAGEIIPERLAAYSQPAVLLGECAKLTVPENGIVTMAPQASRLPKAVSVALLGQQAYTPGTLQDYFGLEPFYIRKSEAEELWDKRHKK